MLVLQEVHAVMPILLLSRKVPVPQVTHCPEEDAPGAELYVPEPH